MTHTRAARRYAAALMAAAEQAKVGDAVTKDLETVETSLRTSRELRLLVISPIVRQAKKAAAFKALFASRVNPQTMMFIDLLIAKRREGILQETIVQFMKLRDIQMGIVNVNVVSAVELTRQQEDALRGQMERTTGKKVRLHVSLDPGIKGGLVVRIGDTVLDASIKHQLIVLGERFAHGEYSATA